MIIFPRWPWRRLLADYGPTLGVVLVAPVLFVGISFLASPVPPITNPFFRPVLAAQDAPDQENPCEAWGEAGAVPIYRCIDEEQYIVCYSQGGFMLFCLPQQ